jgi:hypothetical protein
MERGARTGIDWNRDGRISEEPVRAGLSWATYKSCDAAGFARTTLAKPVPPASPALVAIDGELHAFWIDDNGELGHRMASVRACDARTPQSCVQLGSTHRVDGPAGLQAIAAAAGERTELVLAQVAQDGRLQVSAVGLGRDGVPIATPAVAIAGARTAHAPTVAWMTVDAGRYGVERVLSVLFVADDAHGTLMQASARTAAGPFLLRPVIDDALRPITTPLAPAIASLGTGELCGAFADAESSIRFYCYDLSRDLWRDHSARAFYAGLGPRTGGPVGLAYHRYRSASGTVLHGDETRGALYLSFTEPAPGDDLTPDNPQLLISEWLDAAHPAATSIQFRWRGNVVNQWTHLAKSTSLVLYEDNSLQALAGAMVRRAKDRHQLELLPFVDGAFDVELGAGNDFEVMERGICTQLRGARACDSPSSR